MLLAFYGALYDRFGPQKWWPGETPFEVIVGAILTQNTNWGNVERAISRLQADGLMNPLRLSETPPDYLSTCLRPAGFYRVKASRLLNFITYFRVHYDLDIRRMGTVSSYRLREELLAINGIGPETADSILLYAFNRPIFVVDSYTRRVLVRHHLIDEKATYSEIQRLFASSLPEEAQIFNEYHALLVRVGKSFCRAKARCR
ncbi:MAG: endonuclease, partial [Candidatus Glassbacteria bacterium RBG_16_58_8]